RCPGWYGCWRTSRRTGRGPRSSTCTCAVPPRSVSTSPSKARTVRVAVIGTGLIGTSVALALREHGTGVWLADADPEAARLAANLGAGELLPEPGPEMGPEMGRADVAVIAVPPSAVAATLAAAQARGLAA